LSLQVDINKLIDANKQDAIYREKYQLHSKLLDKAITKVQQDNMKKGVWDKELISWMYPVDMHDNDDENIRNEFDRLLEIEKSQYQYHHSNCESVETISMTQDDEGNMTFKRKTLWEKEVKL